MMLHNPLSFVDLRVAKTVHKHKEISANETNEDDESAMDELESVTNSLIREVGQNGIESKSAFNIVFALFLFSDVHVVKESYCC